ncbi:MAG: hypothetical protein HOO06_11310 [Bdellovibrionaceae bacterium]|nr:hypothetical protein [Pseudobdellovibrionaceae bacterium]
MKLIGFVIILFVFQLAVGESADSSKPKQEGSSHDSHGVTSDEHKKTFKVGRALSTDKNTTIPSTLVTIIEEYYLKRFRAKDSVRAGFSSRVDLVNKLIRKYVDFDVVLTADQHKALKSNYKFSFTRGGGVIDLADYVSEKRGRFNLKIQFDTKEFISTEEEIGNLKVYFLSMAKKRSILGENIGAGCFKYMDLTKYYHNVISRDGVILNSAYQRYVSIVGGTFFFFYSELDSLYLGSLTFIDSRYPYMFCKEKKAKVKK